MFGFGSIGGGEIAIILLVALLLFGPRRIPEIGRTVGKALSEFRKATNEFRTSLEREVDMERVRGAGEALRQARTDIAELTRDPVEIAPPPPAPTPRPEPPAPAEGEPSESDVPRES